MTDLTPERLAELRRIAEAATPGPWEWNKYLHLFSATGKPVLTKPFSPDNPDVVEAMPEDLDYIETFNPETALALLDEIERLWREREASIDIPSREDIGDGAKVEEVRLILKGGDKRWQTRESERARLVAEVGECCRGADPMCAAGCLVEVALKAARDIFLGKLGM